MTDEWDLIGYVRSSQYRNATVHHLHNYGPSLPSEIADGEDHALPHVSRALSELRDRDVVDLLVSEERQRGRIYGLTDRGRKIADRVLRDIDEITYTIVEQDAFEHPELLSYLVATVGSALQGVTTSSGGNAFEVVLPGRDDETVSDALEETIHFVCRDLWLECQAVIDCFGSCRYTISGFAEQTVVQLVLDGGRGVGICVDADQSLELPAFVDRCLETID